MPREPNEQAQKWDQREIAALYLLTEDETPPVWKVADIGRHLDYFDPWAVVRPRIAAGLMHRIAKKFVVATPAAYKWVALVGEVV